MATTVKELIAWLQTQDQEANVTVLHSMRGSTWEGDLYCREDLDVSLHTEYMDLRGNPFAVGTIHENYRELFLGCEDWSLKH